jgi:hypothetical protein
MRCCATHTNGLKKLVGVSGTFRWMRNVKSRIKKKKNDFVSKSFSSQKKKKTRRTTKHTIA